MPTRQLLAMPALWQSDTSRLIVLEDVTIWLNRVGKVYEREYVTHQGGMCHLCGVPFRTIAESIVKHWCVDCYARYVNHRGRETITDWAREIEMYGRG